MAEREQGLHLVLAGVPAVAEKYTLAVTHLRLLAFGVRRRVVPVVHRIVLPAALEADRQLALGRALAEQDLGQGAPALLARVPVLQQRRHLAEPVLGGVVAARGDADDGLAIGGGNRLDQRFLAPGQAEGAVVGLALRSRIEAHRHHRRVGLRRDRLRLRRDQVLDRLDAQADARVTHVRPVVQLDRHRFAGGEAQRGVERCLAFAVRLLDHGLAVDQQLVGVEAGGGGEEQVVAAALRHVTPAPAHAAALGGRGGPQLRFPLVNARHHLAGTRLALELGIG